MTHPANHLKKILKQIQTFTSANEAGKESDKKNCKRNCLVVFDLDSTLFDVSPRIQKILRDFAQVAEHRSRFPESCALLETIEVQRTAWDIRDSLVRAGLDGHHPDFHQAIKDFWRLHFFESQYLQFDQPYDGAVDYVKAVYAHGAQIVYLTGRDVERMGPGSYASLQQWKFPLDHQQAILALKPHKDMDDAKFKSDYFAQAGLEQYKKIWFFENEPVNIDLVRQDHPGIEIVFFNSTHSGLSQAPQDLPTIMHYLLD